MRKKIIAGNWKMNKTAGDARSLVADIMKLSVDASKAHVIIIPPQVYLSEFGSLSKANGVSIGAQNSYPKNEGAFTGEVSAYILKSLGVEYCLVGHSERRKYFGEADLDCLEKVNALLEQGLTPILCVGEELSVREEGKHFDHVKKQLLAVLTSVTPTELTKIIIAYEPVWAIGTGKTATTQQASEMHSYIRQLISDQFDAKIASQVYVLYGGSVNDANAKELMSANDIDGVLVGGASLIFTSFEKIISAVKS